jgi:TetR/AcrR family transcriptional regulator, cholesterol catabolism regulator
MAASASTPQTDTRFSRKRALILKAAAHAFGRKGFHATTLEEIAADLKVTKASLYYYFSTKEELLFEVHLLSLEDLLRRVDGILAQESSPVTQLQAIVTEHLRVLASDYEGAFLLQQEYELPPRYRDDVIALRDRYEQKVLGVVREGVRQRVFRVKDPRVMVRMMLGAVNWFLRWYRADGRLTVDEIADAYIDSIFYGLLAPTLPASLSASSPGRPAASGGIRRLKRRGKPGAAGS